MTKAMTLSAALVLGLVIGVHDGAAIPIGAGAGPGGNEINGGGARLNIDRVNSVNLAAGTYDVMEAEFAFDRVSDADDVVRPFLAIQTGANTYETLWAGGPITAAVGGIETTNYGPGTEQFTLAAATEVFAGFWQGDNIVLFNNQIPTLTAHDNSGVILPDPLQAPGQVLDNFTHPDLDNRTYLFGLNVAPVPEPSTMLLLGSGLAGLGLFRLRHTRVRH